MPKKAKTPGGSPGLKGLGRKAYPGNRGAILSCLGLAGTFAMTAQGLLANSGAFRLVRGALDALMILAWLFSLTLFILRPSLNRYAVYPRYASRAGVLVLGFAVAYGAAEAWFGTGHVFFAMFVVPGFVLARIRRPWRWAYGGAATLALGALGTAARGLRPGLSGLAFVLLPLCLAEAAAQAVERVRLEGEVSLQDLKSRNEHLEELAYRDALTRLYNRRYGLESLRRAVSYAKRYAEELHILVLDIDRFKDVNDRLGHPVGDTVLQGLARILKGSIRDSDIAARIGGEEFLVILPRARPEQARGVAERIREKMARTAFDSVPWSVTVSLGLTGLRKGDTADSFFSRADDFLYESKENGRDRVTGS